MFDEFDEEFMDEEFDVASSEIEENKEKYIAELRKIIALFSEEQVKAIRSGIAEDEEFVGALVMYGHSEKDIATLDMGELLFLHCMISCEVNEYDSFEFYLFSDLRHRIGDAVGVAFNEEFQLIEW